MKSKLPVKITRIADEIVSTTGRKEIPRNTVAATGEGSRTLRAASAVTV